MAAVTCDKLSYSQTLRSGGFTPEQAEASAHARDFALRDTVARKSDLETLKVELEHKLDSVEARLDSKLDRVAADLKREMTAQKVDLVKWLIPILLGQVALTVALMKLL